MDKKKQQGVVLAVSEVILTKHLIDIQGHRVHPLVSLDSAATTGI